MTASALARAGLTVTAAYLLSRLLGWVRVVVLGNVYHASAELDAYYAAFRIPDLVYQLVAAGAIASAVIPVLAHVSAGGELDRAWRIASGIANLMLLALLGVAGVMFLIAPAIMPALVPGFDPATTELTVQLTRLMLLSPIFLALGALVSAVLNTEGRFGAAALAPLAYNVCIIVGVLALAPVIGIFGAAVGVVVGSVAHLVVQLPALRRRFAYTRTLALGDPGAREALRLMLPRAVAMGASQITFAINTSLATGIGVGAVVAYNVAFNLLQIPLGVIGVPLGVVILPSLARALAQGHVDTFASMVGGSLRLLLWMALFVSAVGIALRQESVALLFGGSFDDAALVATGATLGIFLLGLPAHAMNVVLSRAFFSAKDTTTPVIVALASVGVNVVVSLLTVERLGLSGLALGIALGGWFDALMLTYLLTRRPQGVAAMPLLRSALRSLVGAVAAGIAAAVTLRLTESALGVRPSLTLLAIELLAAAGAGLIVFLVYGRLTRAPEQVRAGSLIRAAVRRGGGA